MRKLSLLAGGAATAGLLVLAAAGAADAQQSRRGGTAAEGPAHPCRPALMQFDNALSRMVGAQAEGQAGMFPDATRMRNEGMQACMGGRVDEGRRMIQQAAQALRG